MFNCAGIEKGVMYRFIQEDASNYYHALGFAYYPDGALDDQPELEPGVSRSGFLSLLLLHGPMILMLNHLHSDVVPSPDSWPR